MRQLCTLPYSIGLGLWPCGHNNTHTNLQHALQFNLFLTVVHILQCTKHHEVVYNKWLLPGNSSPVFEHGGGGVVVGSRTVVVADVGIVVVATGRIVVVATGRIVVVATGRIVVVTVG